MSQTAESDSSSDITDDGQYFVPTNGTYLVVQLDPVNMFDPLDDAGIAAAVQALRPKKYIAYVYHIMELPIPKRPDHKCRIALVGRGLCPQDDDARIDASMCVPISPATEHPLSRKPVPTTPPFPFPDCYQYSMAIPTIRIPTKHFYDHTNAVSIPLYDRFPVKIYYSEDHCNRAAQLKAKVEVIAPPLPDKASENQHSARIASSSNTLELGRTVNSAFATVDTPIDVAQPGVDTRHGEPQVACGAEDTRRGDSITDSSPSKPSAPRTMEDDSQDTSPAQVLCLPDVAEVGSVDSASAEAPAVAETARLADDDGSSGSYTPSMIESIADRPRSSSPAPSDLLQQVFLGDPDEDREIIPLVSVSLNLSEVSEGNDPMEFLREMEVIQR
ncbi:uncharacterized protein C8Q71DRAFT_860455 [Rhodofomes roseus]|uniref:Uncharacterized protein n=1 Tax=Rhodofomes roseus TaxID=34475 RepID=A0ABQ8K7E6_9APHY|nr:uncharacterized protein C8Q71DRAFT_860455 [Rhodofomes roseus]KAH9833180.1 hypothetical protein C8Q71DRAFT_860455 [Rhodofomes roseus]